MSAVVDFAELVLAAKTDGLKKGEAALDGLADQAEKTEKRTGKATEKIGADFTKVGGTIARAAGGALAALVTFQQASQAVTNARGFQGALSETSTLIAGTAEEMDFLSSRARALARDFGTDATQQVQAFYQAISAGADSLEGAADILESANKLAIGGVTDVTTGVDALTTSVNAYKKDGLTAAAASDAMFVAMKGGKTTIGELSASLGQIVPISSAAGVSFDETTAAVAALTTQGLSTSMAVTGLRGILSAVIAPTKQASDTAAALGVEFSASALEAQGLSKFLNGIIEAANGDKEALASLFGSVEALNAVLSMAGGGGAAFSRILSEMGNKAGATDAAFEKMASGFDQRWNRAVAAFGDIALGLGNALLTVVVPALETAAAVVGGLATFLTVSAEEQRRAARASETHAQAADILKAALEGVNLQTRDGAEYAKALAKERLNEAKASLAAAEAELQLFVASSKLSGRNRRGTEVRLESNVEAQQALLDALRKQIADMGIEIEDSPIVSLPGKVSEVATSLDDLKNAASGLDGAFSGGAKFGGHLSYLAEQIAVLERAQRGLKAHESNTAIESTLKSAVDLVGKMGLASDEADRLRDMIGDISANDPFADQAVALAKVVDFIEKSAGSLGEMNAEAYGVYDSLLKALNTAISMSQQDYTSAINDAGKSAAYLAQQFGISYQYASALSQMQVNTKAMTFGSGVPGGIGGSLGAGFGRTSQPLTLRLPSVNVPPLEPPSAPNPGGGGGSSRQNDLMEEGIRLTEELRTEQEKYSDALAQAKRLLDAGAISQETYNRHVAQLKEEYQGVSFENVIAGIDSVSDALARAIVTGGSLGDAFANVLRQMAQDALSSGIKKILTDQLTPSGGGTSLFGALFGGLFGGAKAGGGSVKSGMSYEVGENGKELFVPTQDGTIVPHGAYQRGGVGVSSQTNLSVSIDLTGANGDEAISQIAEAAVRRGIEKATPRIVGASVSATYERAKERPIGV